MATFDSLSDVISDTLESAFAQKELFSVTRRKIAPYALFQITEHAQNGKFVGGKYANKGYSDATLPAYFFGDLEKDASDVWRIQSPNQNITNNPGDKLIWRTSGNDNKMAYLVGGYKEWRRLSGRSTGFVNLTFTGRMLGSMQTTTRPSGSGNQIEVSIGGSDGQEDKVYYTNEQREWLYLSKEELKNIESVIEKFIDDKTGNLPSATINL